MKQLKFQVFLPVFILLLLAVLLNLINEAWFSTVLNQTNNWILDRFDWLFAAGTLLMFCTCLIAFISPFGNLRIGGANAEPILTRWQLFSITLCSTIATGILFWGTAEPVFHLEVPTRSLGITPGSDQAGVFALSTLFFHWSFMPYAIYSVSVVAFGIAFFNLQKPFSLSAALLLNKTTSRNTHRYASYIDVICLFALVAGMAASLGSGILTIAGGLENTMHIANNEWSRILVTIAIIVAFTISASTGLLRGIRFMSVLNIYLYFGLAFIFLLYAIEPGWVDLVIAGVADFLRTYFSKSIFTITHPHDPWGKDWTVFNWANWLAWAPVTTFFLARISVGYRVKEVLIYNWLIPSLFGIIWMSIFGGISVQMHLSGEQDMIGVLNTGGPESIIYKILDEMPYYGIVAFIFIITVFISFVTAADSNTEAMSALSTAEFGSTTHQSPTWLKISWGVLIGITAYVMIRFAGVDGIKMISTIGGFPVLLLMVIIDIMLLIYIVRFWRESI